HLAGRKHTFKTLLKSHISWLYFLLLFPAVALTNPRTFHNLFNGTTFEEYVRKRYPVEEGTSLVNRYKPSDEKSKKCAEEYFAAAVDLEKKEEYQAALENYN